MVKRKSMQKKKDLIKFSQEDMVIDYLVRKGAKGATNFEMMMSLRICDVRKRISNINKDPLSEFTVESVFEMGKEGKKYKRYWAVPVNQTLEELLLNETKSVKKSGKKRTGGGRR